MSSNTDNQTGNSTGVVPHTDLAKLELTIRFYDLETIELVCDEGLAIVKTLFQALITNGQTNAAQQDNLIYLELGGDDPRVLYFHRSQILTIEANRPVNEDVIYANDANTSTGNPLALNDAPFDDNWKYWIWSNIDRGCPRDEVSKVLLEKGFTAENIRSELGGNPHMGADYLASVGEGGTPEWDMHDPDSALVRLKANGIEAYEFNDLLTSSECAKLVNIMKNDYTRSMVCSEDDANGAVDESRSSSSTYFDAKDSFIQSIEQKISNAIGIDLKYGEAMQGQKYEVGEFFKEHHDYFDIKNENIYKNFCQHGDRTWSLIIYLNDANLEGGETYFPRANLLVEPALGKAVCWKNMHPNGSQNSSTLHSGLAPIRGTKYIITKWFRENPVLAPIDNSKIHYFSTADDLPYLDRKGVGFEKRKLPEHILKLVEEAYDCLKPRLEQEQWDGLTDVISDSDGNNPCDIMSFDHFPELKDRIHKELQPIVQEWVGADNPLIPTDLYGIRSYKRGATLNMHGDRIETHHAGCVVMVDKKVDEDWPLHCVDHNGNTHKVYLEPGELVLYECARTIHGRPEPMVGDWFRNFFAHYKLENWEYRAQNSKLPE